jgi:uncharacterized membrane protein (GlpM family)
MGCAGAALRYEQDAPMLMLTLGLLLKIVMTAGIVVAASVVVERSGPFVGSLIAALPTAGGAALIILAMEHSPAFVSQSAVGSVVSNAICAVFALTYAVLAQRRGLAVSLGGALLVWFGCAALSRLVDWNVGAAVLLNAVVYPVAIYAGRRMRGDGVAKGRVALTAHDLAWRAGVVTLCVIVVTAASHSIGSYFSGIFAFFPVAMGSYFVILHPRIGGKATASVAAHVQAPLIGLGLGLVAVHFLAEPFGVWWSYAAGLSIGIGWNALLWALRQWRKPA